MGELTAVLGSSVLVDNAVLAVDPAEIEGQIWDPHTLYESGFTSARGDDRTSGEFLVTELAYADTVLVQAGLGARLTGRVDTETPDWPQAKNELGVERERFNVAVPILNKDMTLCISLSARPSNNGTRFHNHLYEQLGLNWIYKAFAPTDLALAIAGVRGLGIRGCAISMPYKEDVIALVDVMDPSAKAIDSVNTIVNDGGRLTAYNTDYTAIEQLLQQNGVPTDYSVLLRGSGGMAKATAAALRDAGFTNVTVVARNESSGRSLAELNGFQWKAELDGGVADMLINVTPIGMEGTMRGGMGGGTAGAATEGIVSGRAVSGPLSFPEEAIDSAKVVFDVVALPAETPLIQAGRAAGKTVITGAEVATIQALEQFVLYTGIRPTDSQVRAAEEFMRAQ